MKEPWEWDEEDVLQLIENEVQESLNLDYKSCDALAKTEGRKSEISKDVSSFANSAGGTIVYGVTEDKRVPTGIDAGYDPRDISKEWLEQVINSRIHPRVSGIRINSIALRKQNPGRVIYAVYVPQSDTAHMASDHRHYRRFNFESVPMEAYELRDLMLREKYPSTNVVRAWFDTVINPLLATLKAEQEYLSNRSWTWDRYGRGLQELRHISNSNQSLYSVNDNQEQLLESYPAIEEAVEEHDERVTGFYDEFAKLFAAVRDSAEIDDVYRKTTSSRSLQDLRSAFTGGIGKYETDEDILRELFGSATEPERFAMLAEYVVNNTGDLTPDMKTTAPLWNKHKSEFLLILNQPPIRDCNERMMNAAEALLRSVESLIDLLKKTRHQLARQHGLPYVAVMSAGEDSW